MKKYTNPLGTKEAYADYTGKELSLFGHHLTNVYVNDFASILGFKNDNDRNDLSTSSFPVLRTIFSERKKSCTIGTFSKDE